MRWTPLWPPLGFALNCDSPRFLALAANPAGLFVFPGSVWQSRPVYVVLGAALALPIRILFPMLDWPPLPTGLVASWWAYTLLNFAILLVAICLFDVLLGAEERLTVTAFVFGSWLLANYVVKRFVWTPHTQLFNILVPVVALRASLDALQRPAVSNARAAMLGIVFGIGALAYGSFAIACLAFVASLWLGRCVRAEHVGLGTVARQSLCALGAFALPIVAWWSYVTFRTGGFYSHEVQAYRQFVWIADAWQQGPAELAAVFADNLGYFLCTVANVLWLPAAVLAVLVVLARTSGVSLRRLARDEQALLLATATVFGLTFVFLALLGFYAERLSWALVPPLLVVCVKVGDALDASLGRARRDAFRAGMVLLLAVGVAIEVLAPLSPLSPGSPRRARAWAAPRRHPPRAAPIGSPATSAGRQRAAGARVDGR